MRQYREYRGMERGTRSVELIQDEDSTGDAIPWEYGKVKVCEVRENNGLTAYLSNCCQTPFVCASTPSTESISTTAPSTTRLALSTSIPKSACPGVSMRLNVQSFHLTGILADWIVIPRSRSAGRKSVVVLPVSTEPGVDMNDDLRRMDSVSVVFPESAENEQGTPKGGGST